MPDPEERRHRSRIEDRWLTRTQRLAVLSAALAGALITALGALGFAKGIPAYRFDRLEVRQDSASAERQELRKQLTAVLGELHDFKTVVIRVTDSHSRFLCYSNRTRAGQSGVPCNRLEGNRLPEDNAP